MPTSVVHTDQPPAYAEQAEAYDRRTQPYQYWRQRLVDLLPLRRGDVVLDVGCGTGLCLPLIERHIGPTGAVIGIDRSPQMLTLAKHRIAQHGWHNVTLIESDVADADIPASADAALFCAVHDILRLEQALDNVFRHLRPGAWVAAGGGKWAPAWMVGVNMLVRTTHQPFVDDFEGFDDPCALLRPRVSDLKAIDLMGGYLAVGRASR